MMSCAACDHMQLFTDTKSKETNGEDEVAQQTEKRRTDQIFFIGYILHKGTGT